MDAARCARSTDDELMRAVAVGDRNAFAEIYDRYALQTFEHEMVRVGDRSCAETIVLGVFLDLWRQAPRIRPGHPSLTVWFYDHAHPFRAASTSRHEDEKKSPTRRDGDV
jgi:DNA-directed RNA polymerase specialized sigma24 family protein